MTSPRKLSEEERRQMIASEAYFRAERRGFAGDDAWADWLEAEAEVNAQLGEEDHESLIERLEERLAAADRKLEAARKKLKEVASEARGEWKRDVDKLAKRRDSFRREIGKIREKGAEVGHKARARAEELAEGVSEGLERIERRFKRDD